MDTIGPFHFIALHGSVEPTREQIAPLLARPGIDGLGFVRTGRRGIPFRMTSVVDQVSLEDCLAVFGFYRLLIGAAAVVLIQDGYSYLNEGMKAVVLDVRLLRPPHQVLTAVGGLHPPSGALLECEWELAMVEVNAE